MADDQGQPPSPFAPHYRQPQYRSPYGQPQYRAARRTGQPPYGQPPVRPQQVWWMPQARRPDAPIADGAAAPQARRVLVAIAAATAGVMMAAGFTAVALDNGRGSNNSQAAATLHPEHGQFLRTTAIRGCRPGTATATRVAPAAAARAAPARPRSGPGDERRSRSASSTSTPSSTTAAEQAAGTGIVLTSNGEILTNNHVIDGATSIKVTVVSTGKTYTATVVGDDPTDDVAVLQLERRLRARPRPSSATPRAVAVGDAVTGGRQRRRHRRHAERRHRHGDRAEPVDHRQRRGRRQLREPHRPDPDQRRHPGRRLRRPALRGQRHGHRHRHRGLEPVLQRARPPGSPSRSTRRCRSPSRSSPARATSTIHIGSHRRSSASNSPRVTARSAAATGATISGVVDGSAAAAGRPRGGRHHHRGERPDGLQRVRPVHRDGGLQARASRSRSPGSTAPARATRPR